MGSWGQCDAWLNHQGGRGFSPKAEEEWPGGFVPLSEILLYILCTSMTECITDSFSVSLVYNIVRSLGTGVIYSKMNWRYLINIGLNGKCWVHYEKQMWESFIVFSINLCFHWEFPIPQIQGLRTAGLTWKMQEMLGSHRCPLLGTWGQQVSLKLECVQAPGDLTTYGETWGTGKEAKSRSGFWKPKIQQKIRCTINSKP